LYGNLDTSSKGAKCLLQDDFGSGSHLAAQLLGSDINLSLSTKRPEVPLTDTSS